MTKSLEQIQQENRKFILEAIHGCSYEEALKKELGVGCEVKIKRFISTQDFNEQIFVIDDYCVFFNESFFKTIESRRHNEITEIIGKPLTLSRVLLAISKHGYYDDIFFGDLHGDSYETLEFDLKGVSFDLTKETLKEQSEETQRGINEFFND